MLVQSRIEDREAAEMQTPASNLRLSGESIGRIGYHWTDVPVTSTNEEEAYASFVTAGIYFQASPTPSAMSPSKCGIDRLSGYHCETSRICVGRLSADGNPI